jgi:hypothetical protein
MTDDFGKIVLVPLVGLRLSVDTVILESLVKMPYPELNESSHPYAANPRRRENQGAID